MSDMPFRTHKQSSSWMDSLSRTIEGITDPLGRHETERLDDRCTRIALVARARWIILVVFALYGLCAGVSYSMSSIGFVFSATQTIFLGLSVGTVVLYNAVLSRSCAVLRRFSGLIHIQIGLDLLLVTVLISLVLSNAWPSSRLISEDLPTPEEPTKQYNLPSCSASRKPAGPLPLTALAVMTAVPGCLCASSAINPSSSTGEIRSLLFNTMTGSIFPARMIARYRSRRLTL